MRSAKFRAYMFENFITVATVMCSVLYNVMRCREVIAPFIGNV